MNKTIAFIRSRRLCWWFALAATALGIAELIVYLVAGRTQFDPNYTVEAIVMMAIGISLGVALLVFSAFAPGGGWQGSAVRAAAFAQYICLFFACISYITSQMNLIGNLAYNVDGSVAPAAFVTLVALTPLAFILALAAGVTMKNGVAKEAAV